MNDVIETGRNSKRKKRSRLVGEIANLTNELSEARTTFDEVTQRLHAEISKLQGMINERDKASARHACDMENLRTDSRKACAEVKRECLSLVNDFRATIERVKNARPGTRVLCVNDLETLLDAISLLKSRILS